MVQMKSSLAGIPVSRAMVTDYKVLAPADPLSRAVDLLLHGSQQDFPVVEDGRVVGVLTRSSLMVAVAQQPPATPVGEVMQRTFVEVEAGEMLETAFARLQECQCHTMPVTRAGRLAGLVTSDNLGEFLMVQAALKGRAVGTPRVDSQPAG